MDLPKLLDRGLTLPVLCSPMFIVSGPDLVIAQCKAGVIGAFPALNARPASLLDSWLARIQDELAQCAEAYPDRIVAPFAVNQIIHHSNARLEEDFATCEKHKVPMIITSLRAPNDFVPRIHDWGGIVFHDVTNLRHAEKAIEAGVDGLILVAAGAGGHAGTLNPLALVSEVRRIYDGPIVLSGCITRGEHVLAAQAMGADLAYIGTRFIATHEANADAAYKQMIIEASASDILYTPYFSGIPGNYLRPSVTAAGLDPENLGTRDKADTGLSSAKAWKDIWSAGQGVGGIDDCPSVEQLVARLRDEYASARAKLCSL